MLISKTLEEIYLLVDYNLHLLNCWIRFAIKFKLNLDFARLLEFFATNIGKHWVIETLLNSGPAVWIELDHLLNQVECLRSSIWESFFEVKFLLVLFKIVEVLDSNLVSNETAIIFTWVTKNANNDI